jgi:hypothetical protein
MAPLHELQPRESDTEKTPLPERSSRGSKLPGTVCGFGYAFSAEIREERNLESKNGTLVNTKKAG